MPLEILLQGPVEGVFGQGAVGVLVAFEDVGGDFAGDDVGDVDTILHQYVKPPASQKKKRDRKRERKGEKDFWSGRGRGRGGLTPTASSPRAGCSPSGAGRLWWRCSWLFTWILCLAALI